MLRTESSGGLLLIATPERKMPNKKALRQLFKTVVECMNASYKIAYPEVYSPMLLKNTDVNWWLQVSLPLMSPEMVLQFKKIFSEEIAKRVSQDELLNSGGKYMCFDNRVYEYIDKEWWRR